MARSRHAPSFGFADFNLYGKVVSMIACMDRMDLDEVQPFPLRGGQRASMSESMTRPPACQRHFERRSVRDFPFRSETLCSFGPRRKKVAQGFAVLKRPHFSIHIPAPAARTADRERRSRHAHRFRPPAARLPRKLLFASMNARSFAKSIILQGIAPSDGR